MDDLNATALEHLRRNAAAISKLTQTVAARDAEIIRLKSANSQLMAETKQLKEWFEKLNYKITNNEDLPHTLPGRLVRSNGA
jgi:hypothetical protein